ncbi:MAG TPA: hypothetical protein VIF15_01195 [Polyangiaceae bacterium]|jgi:hypothetical protein
MLRRLLAVGPVVALALACASPTLPLPPPMAPSIGSGPDADHIKLFAPCGGAEANAVMVIVNTNTSVPGDQAVSGSRTDSCGAWDATVFAHSGDFLDITQEFGTTRSQPTVVQVR